MPIYNIKPTDIKNAYQSGLLPQRNKKSYFYQDSSCRCSLKGFNLSSENRRIIKNTSKYSCQKILLADFLLDPPTLNQVYLWTEDLGWQFPKSSIKNVITHHIFNYVYIWKHHDQIIGYAICLVESDFSHIAYVFYNPEYHKLSLPIAMCLRLIIDSIDLGLAYVYLGRFDPDNHIGTYKRNFPNLEVFDYNQNIWQKFQK